MTWKVELSQKAQLEVEVRAAYEELIKYTFNLNTAKKAQCATKRKLDAAMDEAIATMTKADGAEDQRKAKARKASGMALAELWAADVVLMDTQTAYDMAKAKVQMYREIIALMGVEM